LLRILDRREVNVQLLLAIAVQCSAVMSSAAAAGAGVLCICEVLELQSGKLSAGVSNGDTDNQSNRYHELMERNQQLEVSRSSSSSS